MTTDDTNTPDGVGAALRRAFAASLPANTASALDALAAAGVALAVLEVEAGGGAARLASASGFGADGAARALPTHRVAVAHADPLFEPAWTVAEEPADAALESLAWGLLRHAFPGWEFGAGGRAEVVFDAGRREVRAALSDGRRAAF